MPRSRNHSGAAIEGMRLAQEYDAWIRCVWSLMAAGRSHSHSHLRVEKFPAASTWEPKVLRIDGQWLTRSKRPGTKFWLWPESSLKPANDDRAEDRWLELSIESLLCGCSGRLANLWGARCSGRRLTLQGDWPLAAGRRIPKVGAV